MIALENIWLRFTHFFVGVDDGGCVQKDKVQKQPMFTRYYLSSYGSAQESETDSRNHMD
jgi:hypothetical protein